MKHNISKVIQYLKKIQKFHKQKEAELNNQGKAVVSITQQKVNKQLN